jgi:peptidyl-prolyl cis-trans isomerase SurA
MNRMKKGLLTLALTCLLPLLLLKISAAKVVERIVAEVNDDIITMSELQAASKSVEAQSGLKPSGSEEKQIERKMLDALIDRKLADAEAKRRGIHIEDKEIQAALDNFKKKNNLIDDEALKKALSGAGITMKELKKNIADQLTQERLITVAVGAKAVVNESEVRRFYEEKYKGAGAQLHLRIIKIPFPPGATEAQKETLKQKAESVMMDMKNGASFSDAAAKNSLSETDVGFVSQSDLDPKLVDFLSKLKPKDVAPAIAPQGIQLIQLVERRSGAAKSFEEAAPAIRRALQQQEMKKKFATWVKTLRAKAHIKIML